jgi:hypothetical protein
MDDDALEAAAAAGAWPQDAAATTAASSSLDVAAPRPAEAAAGCPGRSFLDGASALDYAWTDAALSGLALGLEPGAMDVGPMLHPPLSMSGTCGGGGGASGNPFAYSSAEILAGFEASVLDTTLPGWPAAAVDEAMAGGDLGDGDESWWTIPTTACVDCAVGGVTCKLPRNGPQVCTTCSVLGRACSFVAGSCGAEVMEPFADPAAMAGGGAFEEMEEEEEEAAAEQQQQAPQAVVSEEAAATTTTTDDNAPSAKTNTRFSRASVRTLKDWLLAHSRHP